jgi:hypothetical protein
MDGKLGLDRLWRWARTRPEADTVDAADMGTAFGMELSIFEAERHEAGAAATAGEPGDATPPTRRPGG